MEISRRDCLLWSAVGVAGASLFGCNPFANQVAPHPEELPLPTGDIQPEVRLLNRAAFGPRPGDLARLKAQGFEAYLQQELRADNKEPISLQMQLQREDVGQIDDPDIEDLPQGEVIRQLQQEAILRAVYSENQLKERLVDHWSNHFNIYARKGDSAFRLGNDERDVIRKNACGRFRDLLQASSHSVAMLAFLDNPQNLNLHPNENYGRELMELHTLGIGGGYTQKDVQEVSRCFTGWTLETRFLRPKGKLRFDPERHDDGQKLVLGHVIPPGGGQRDVQEVLSILAAHPSTSRFIAKKLVLYFHGDADPRLIDQVATIYGRTDGDIPSMVKALLDPRVLADAPPRIKRPFDLIAGAVRATRGDTDGNNGVQEHLLAMGEPVYLWPMPDGYPVKTAAWMGSMLPRWNFAHAFAHGKIRGSGPGQVHDIQEATLLHGTESGKRILKTRFEKKEEELALCLAAPEFQWC